MTTRHDAFEAVQELLPLITRLYGVGPGDLRLCPAHDGCQNLVFFYERDGAAHVLRVSFRDDRPPEQIAAELDFVRYLHENGARVSPPVESLQGRFLEVIPAASRRFAVASFKRAPGHRLPDKGYKYRDGAPIDEYYRNWGGLLGRMHRLARDYVPRGLTSGRPRLLDDLAGRATRDLPASYDRVRKCCRRLLAEVSRLPEDRDAYGLIHADFSDGNLCVDYATGDLTAFDFDDAAYGWFMYDLADAWRSGTGWVRAEPDPGKRRDFMAAYFDTLLGGYTREHALPDPWLGRLPTFLKLVELEAVLGEAREGSLGDRDDEYDGATEYRLKCIEEDIPFLGFFDSIYSPEHPFQLAEGV